MEHSDLFLKAVQDAKTRIKEITVEETNEKQQRGDDFILIDTREDHEWERGRIEGAVHLGKGVIERDIQKMVPDLNKELVLYCGGGFRSALAADSLRSMGYTNVKSMAGGWRSWQARGLPIHEQRKNEE